MDTTVFINAITPMVHIPPCDMNKNLKKRRIKLWEKSNGLCYWCKRKTILPNELLKKYNTDQSGEIPQEALYKMATIEHIYSRFHPKRNSNNDSHEERLKLSCYECNHERGKKEKHLLSRVIYNWIEPQ